MQRRRLVGLIVGPLLFLAILFAPGSTALNPAAQATGAVATLMAIWWVSEALPIAATALLPIVLFPLLGVMPTTQVTPNYANHLIFLFLGGFLIAIAMQEWNLHRRIALRTIALVGTAPSRLILGFMLATALLSMWISNTATTMMMLPIALAVLEHHPEDERRYGAALMLGIAYAASIGGVATLIGTPPNAILAGMVQSLYGETIGFARWLAFGLPLSLVMLAACWYYLTHIAFPLPTTGDASTPVTDELAKLPPMSREEKLVLLVFTAVGAGWVLRGVLDLPALKGVSDATIAMAGALALFVIPSDWRQGRMLLDWQHAVKLPWDIILLFGGGFALAKGFSSSGLAEWIVQGATGVGGELWLLVGLVALVVLFLTELTSNTATATLVVPLMGAFAAGAQLHPYTLMVPAAIAASFAFMLPVATPPNAIVFSSRHVSMAQMAHTGLWLNLLAVGLITLFVLWWMPLVWGIELIAR